MFVAEGITVPHRRVLPWDLSSCWISSRKASSSYSFMTLNICLEQIECILSEPVSSVTQLHIISKQYKNIPVMKFLVKRDNYSSWLTSAMPWGPHREGSLSSSDCKAVHSSSITSWTIVEEPLRCGLPPVCRNFSSSRDRLFLSLSTQRWESGRKQHIVSSPKLVAWELARSPTS